MESDFIRWLRQRLAPMSPPQLGIGDDAAVVSCGAESRIVVTTDMLMEGVDFVDVTANARRIGRKSLAVNLSDLAAMAARPVSAFVAVALPRQGGLRLAQELYEGILGLSRDFEVPIAGGDTNSWDGPLVIAITALGEVSEKGPLLRRGARPGDRIVVTGQFGGSRLGRHLDFVPRVREAIWLQERYSLNAGIDVSDGLSLDLARLAEESGCGAVIDLQRVPVSPDAYQWSKMLADGVSPLEHALSDGEDFELILAVESAVADQIVNAPPPGVAVAVIGEFIEGSGLWQSDHDGRIKPLLPRGYEHTLT